MQRIVVIGACGAGKSVLARRLGELLGLPVIHLDALNWYPGWVSMPQVQWRHHVQHVVQGDRWIIDGNYGGTLDIRLPAADTIVFLDLPRWLCLWRIIRRIIKYHGQTRPDMGPDCPERVDWEFLEYVWNFPEHSRPKIVRQIARFAAGKRVFHLIGAADVERFLQQVEQTCR